MSSDAADFAEVAAAMVAHGADAVSESALVEAGWDTLLDLDDRTAVTSLFEQAGRAAVPTGALALVLRAAVPELAEAARPLLVVGVWTGGSIFAAGPVVEPWPERLIAWSPDLASPRLFVAAIRGSEGFHTVDGVDPGNWSRLDRAAVDVARVVEGPPAVLAVHAVTRALLHERLGALASMLETAVEHVTTRDQFGRPVGSYQAIQHGLVDVHVRIQAARVALETAWEVRSTPALQVAVIQVAEAADSAIAGCLQACGGIGFTAEFPLAARIRRDLALSALLGPRQCVSDSLGESLAAAPDLARLGDIGA